MSTDIDHIDALVKRADPVDPRSLPGPDSRQAERIWERVRAAALLETDAPSGLPAGDQGGPDACPGQP